MGFPPVFEGGTTTVDVLSLVDDPASVPADGSNTTLATLTVPEIAVGDALRISAWGKFTLPAEAGPSHGISVYVVDDTPATLCAALDWLARANVGTTNGPWRLDGMLVAHATGKLSGAWKLAALMATPNAPNGNADAQFGTFDMGGTTAADYTPPHINIGAGISNLPAAGVGLTLLGASAEVLRG